jgi:hypothetical protein
MVTLSRTIKLTIISEKTPKASLFLSYWKLSEHFDHFSVMSIKGFLKNLTDAMWRSKVIEPDAKFYMRKSAGGCLTSYAKLKTEVAMEKPKPS